MYYSVFIWTKKVLTALRYNNLKIKDTSFWFCMHKNKGNARQSVETNKFLVTDKCQNMTSYCRSRLYLNLNFSSVFFFCWCFCCCFLDVTENLLLWMQHFSLRWYDMFWKQVEIVYEWKIILFVDSYQWKDLLRNLIKKMQSFIIDLLFVMNCFKRYATKLKNKITIRLVEYAIEHSKTD